MAINRRTITWILIGLVLVGGVAAAIVILGPVISPVQGCTMMGCIGGLDIEFAGLQPETYTVDVSSPDGQTQTFECSASSARAVFNESGCAPNGLHLGDATPDEITVKVTWDGGSKTETFQVNYQVLQPNGPQCEPICHVGKVTMQLP